MKTNQHNISDELLAAFIDGSTTQEQNEYILEAFKENPELYEEFRIGYLAANILDNASGNNDLSVSNINLVPGAIVGAEIFNYPNLFDHSQIQNHSSMVAASNNDYSDDRINEILGSIYSENANQNIMETKNSATVIGDNPQNIVSGEVQQQYNDTCAIKSQQLVLNDFGIHVTEDQLVKQAENLNIYHPGQGGTSSQDVGKLLDMNGISCTRHENASVYDLTSALAKGEKIIVGVDSSELWKGGITTKISDMIHGEQADHALIVAGIDTTDPNNVQVILTDPGTGQEGARYPIAQFLDAWHDSGNFMVTTDAPAPLAYNPEMINFDYSAGHLSTIGHLPYDYFDQTIMPLSQHIENKPYTMDMLHDNFSALINGAIDICTLLGLDPSIGSMNQNILTINGDIQNTEYQTIDIHHDILSGQETLHPDITQNGSDHLNIDDLLDS